MIDCTSFYETLTAEGIDFFTGVPDSLLKDFCATISDCTPADRHVIAANEGSAVALACGHHLATGRPALVYMQNSGQGNALNPLTSLASPEVYGLPMLLLVGWRGEPGVSDEPQHIKQGAITRELSELLGFPTRVLPGSEAEATPCVRELLALAIEQSTPVALLVRKGTFGRHALVRDGASFPMTREQAVVVVARHLATRDIVVCTTGMPSRELYEARAAGIGEPGRDFLTVGGMGHASQIAMGIAIDKPERQVFCLDGDGALLMHMGALAIIGSCRPQNFKHVVLNNGAHDSVGGQPTAAFAISIPDIATACGYEHAWSVENSDELAGSLKRMRELSGPCLLEVRVRRGARTDLGRPKTTPAQNKDSFMEFLRS